MLKERKEHLARAEGLRKQMNEDIRRAKTDTKFQVPLLTRKNPSRKQMSYFTSYVWVEGEASQGAQGVGSMFINNFKN